MKPSNVVLSLSIGLLLAFSASAVPALAQSTSQTQPDNTRMNRRDRNEDQPTADQQKMNSTDRALTAKVRKAVMADKSLSTYAHNVKIISQDGTVTLKGPVRSEEEMQAVMAKATEAAGSSDKVVNQMSVKQQQP